MKHDGKNLILLFGLPRSGTTWIGKIFDSHPDVVYRHEPEAVHAIDGLPFQIDESDLSPYFTMIRDYALSLQGMSHPRVAGKLPLLPKRYLGPIRHRLHEASLLLATLGARASLSLPVYHPVKRLPADDLHVVWKSVVGLGRLPAIKSALPQARAIIIQRHPCGFVASQLRGLKAEKFGGAPSRPTLPVPLFGWQKDHLRTRYAITDEELDALTVEERMAWRWVLWHEKVLERMADIPGWMPVWYDDICRDPATQFRKLFAFANLDWPQETARFLGETVNNEDPEYYSVFKNPLSAANRWRDELGADVIARVLAIVRRSPASPPIDAGGHLGRGS